MKPISDFIHGHKTPHEIHWILLKHLQTVGWYVCI